MCLPHTGSWSFPLLFLSYTRASRSTKGPGRFGSVSLLSMPRFFRRLEVYLISVLFLSHTRASWPGLLGVSVESQIGVLLIRRLWLKALSTSFFCTFFLSGGLCPESHCGWEMGKRYPLSGRVSDVNGLKHGSEGGSGFPLKYSQNCFAFSCLASSCIFAGSGKRSYYIKRSCSSKDTLFQLSSDVTTAFLTSLFDWVHL